jgi:hypothetical protein
MVPGSAAAPQNLFPFAWNLALRALRASAFWAQRATTTKERRACMLKLEFKWG